MKNHLVTILHKDGKFAAFALDQGENTPAFVGRYDARCQPPVFYQTAENLTDATKLLNVNLDISISRGWRIGYEGVRNYG